MFFDTLLGQLPEPIDFRRRVGSGGDTLKLTQARNRQVDVFRCPLVPFDVACLASLDPATRLPDQHGRTDQMLFRPVRMPGDLVRDNGQRFFVCGLAFLVHRVAPLLCPQTLSGRAW